MLSGKYFACVIQQGFKFITRMIDNKVPKLGELVRAPISERRQLVLSFFDSVNKHSDLFESSTFEKALTSFVKHVGEVYNVRHKSVGLGKDLTADLEVLLLKHIKGFNQIKRVVAYNYGSIESTNDEGARKVLNWANKLYVKGNVQTRSYYIMTADDMYTQLDNDAGLTEGFDKIGLLKVVQKLKTVHDSLKEKENQILEFRAEELSAERDNSKILDAAFQELRVFIDLINAEVYYSDKQKTYKELVWALSSIISKAKSTMIRKATMRRNKREKDASMNGGEMAKAPMQPSTTELIRREGYEFEDDNHDSDSEMIQIPELPAWHPSVDGASQPLQNGSLEPKTRDEKSKVI